MVTAQRWVEFEEGLGIKYAPEQRARRLGEVLNLLLKDGGEFSPETAQSFIKEAEARGSSEPRKEGRPRKRA